MYVTVALPTHVHVPSVLLHSPWSGPQQSLGHVALPQSMSQKGWWHWHSGPLPCSGAMAPVSPLSLRGKHAPCPVQLFGHQAVRQSSSYVHGSSHVQRPVSWLQIPWPLQLPEHMLARDVHSVCLLPA